MNSRTVENQTVSGAHFVVAFKDAWKTINGFVFLHFSLFWHYYSSMTNGLKWSWGVIIGVCNLWEEEEEIPSLSTAFIDYYYWPFCNLFFHVHICKLISSHFYQMSVAWKKSFLSLFFLFIHFDFCVFYSSWSVGGMCENGKWIGTNFPNELGRIRYA